jgi:hypothetical protein
MQISFSETHCGFDLSGSCCERDKTIEKDWGYQRKTSMVQKEDTDEHEYLGFTSGKIIHCLSSKKLSRGTPISTPRPF